MPPDEAASLPTLIADVRRRVPEGEPIYVAPRRSDLVTFSNPLLYYLVGRPNVLRRDVLLQAKPEEQARDRAQARARAAEGGRSAGSRPSRRSRSRTGAGGRAASRALDDYLNAAYREDARYGDYALLVPR